MKAAQQESLEQRIFNEDSSVIVNMTRFRICENRQKTS